MRGQRQLSSVPDRAGIGVGDANTVPNGVWACAQRSGGDEEVTEFRAGTLISQ